MLSRAFIKNKAVKFQTTELNIIREYCQHLFLSNFYQQKASDRVLFKGGTALRIIYYSPRFSEDLDFTGHKISIKGIEDLIANTALKIGEFGILTDIKESKKTSGGYLGVLGFKLFNFNAEIQIEISLRKINNIKNQPIVVVNDFIPSYSAITLTQENLVTEKINAVLTRSKPRDWYDLYFLLRANLVSARNKKTLIKLLGKLRREKINFKSELKNLLPKSHHLVLKNFRGNLEREIKHRAGL